MNNFINFNFSDREALLGFAYFDRLGFKKINKLKNICSSYQKAFNASYEELVFSGISQELATRFIGWRYSFDFSQTLSFLKKEGIGFISIIDEEYPSLLKETSSPPLVLFYLGEISLISKSKDRRLAIVGSRKANEYANQVLSYIIPVLVENNLIIVSGLAMGVDAIAHRETIKNKGETIAILGTGLDKPSFYPPINSGLAEDIIKNSGLLLSEFPPGTKAKAINFPRRNRIISGICQATLVVQAEKKSGSLITAAYALEQNREVLSVPGNIFCNLSQGTNNLIKEGAKTIINVDDILEIYE